jgi:hypothetical protein
MKSHKGIRIILVVGLMVAGLSACESEGPAEKAGKAIDEAASDVADKAKETTEQIEKKMTE